LCTIILTDTIFMLKFSKIQEIIPKNEISLLKNISDMGHEEIIFCS